jgi:ubiquinone/menaquinone biosynthesis C-methylase UbiE
MTKYLFETNRTDREWKRLRMIEQAVDAETIALLERAGLGTGARCLEIGAGAGSIVGWMAKRVGLSGRVIAVDKKTAYLQPFQEEPVRVIEGNLKDLLLDHPVDLAHARYVLIHNANDGELLAKIRSAVKPGGMAVLEEPDFTSAALLQPERDNATQRVNRAICKMFTDVGLDPAYGLRLPQKVEEAGFALVHTESRLHLCAGETPIARVMAESADVLRDEYKMTGLATDKDIAHYVARARNPRVWSVFYATVSVTARRS